MKKHGYITLVILAITMLVALNAYSSGGNKHWSYTGADGPDKWGSLSPEYSTCKSGTGQSPVNISKTIGANVGDIEFNYNEAPLKMLNNGHTIQVNYSPGSSITVNGRTYNLLQFHFHSPSEDTVKGKHYDMQAHFVHKSDDGQLAVVGVFLKKGKNNSFVQTLWNEMPHEVNHEVEGHSQINGMALLPSNGSYYHFTGSLTTPPCSESVQWFVLKTPVEVSAEQVEKFVSAVGHNARPTQPVNDRAVIEYTGGDIVVKK